MPKDSESESELVRAIREIGAGITSSNHCDDTAAASSKPVRRNNTQAASNQHYTLRTRSPVRRF
jgi:hypothetical protein